MPLRVFWLLHSNINRLLAETDMRELSIATACQGAEGTKELYEKLFLEYDEPFKGDPLEEQPDQIGIEELKGLQ